ncbi:STAS domain-containing protein [Campylobacter sp. RM16192]|uniref:STAS domain-containing protein n=1 Tax=Campylobacter sp. RM16192 TaxID=1660080 RepID=UPI00145139CC|nr:STAS domain-containing protein [Campylobacter sp. RM16192]QCD52313.1 putative chemotaxis protein [Campylobacter sp. RM16192]
MKPKIKDSVAIFYPHGFLDGDASKYEIYLATKELVLSKKIECILISLKKVVYFNKRGINSISLVMSEIAKKVDANVAFCDYDETKFKALREMSPQSLNLSFFDSEEVAMLFFGNTEKSTKEKKIILFHENQEQKNQISLKLVGRGYIVYTAKDVNEFKNSAKNYNIKINLTHININEKTIAVQVRENVVIYKLTGFIDSNFAENFDMSAHNNSLKIGFKFFVFDATRARSANIHGVSFLARLSTSSAEYGATIAICGLSGSNTSETLRNDLEDSGILLYNSVEDFFNDDGSISGGPGMKESMPHNITRNLVQFLPLILKTTIDTLSSMAKIKVERGKIFVKTFDMNQKVLTGCIAFYGDIDAKILLSLDKSIVQKACAIFLQDDKEASLNSAFGNFMVIIGNKILSILESKKIKVDITMPNVFENYIQDGDTVSKGAFVELVSNGTKGALFLSR